MKKIALFIVLLLASVSLHAETEMRMRNLENRVSKLEEKNQSHTPSYDPITPNAGPKVLNGMDMFFTADFIYWTGRLDSLTHSQTGIGLNPPKGNLNSVDWSWNPGFKTGFGWTCEHGGWDLYLQYTWFYSNASDSIHATHLFPTFEILSPFITAATIDSLDITHSHSHWDLHYQVGDLELGRNYYINRYLTFRPFISIKGTWQKQDYNVFFNRSISLTIDNVQTLTNYSMRQNQMIWGIGMCTGLNTAWHFYKWFSLYGDFALTGIWMHYDLDRKDVFSDILDPLLPEAEWTTANMQNTLHVVKPVFEFGIGLRIESYFYRNQLHIRLQAGWETHIWPNQTIYLGLQEQHNRYDLSLQGLTVKFRLDF